ncbi:fungal-specific transcription factor domain-containing protein [Paraphoma chrysanthemicola]|uniref:Fungal-specific transcription factor domain-containing protein n=1 Tax=Paraphoma chrysanthemicola TaxID=798071 RepID=A0A8K0W4N6_9PLEO|nr:fungal-specific transcription factor domain-containing protein [Paraphoma chrysanthemicola]
MSSPANSGASPVRRQRTVEGSCWQCKQRRVKCDLQKPSCGRCLISRAEDCSYDKILLRWKGRPAKNLPWAGSQLIREHTLGGLPLATNERRAIDYFKSRLWPLFSTVHEPCPPPISLALRSQPVLQALCVFAEEHRALLERGSSKQTLERRRLNCLEAIRSQLGDESVGSTALSSLLVAVLLLYFLEGYVNCTNCDASTQCHLAGALAIINSLGGFDAAWTTSDRISRMLLSELASTDLTDALLQNRRPSFSATIWERMEIGSVWWESVSGPDSLGAVFSTMAEMSFYHHELQAGKDISNEKTQAFERALQPTYSMLDYMNKTSEQEVFNPRTTASLSLIRAFQHTALIFLYSAILKIPAKHFLVQQHVHACLECIQGMDTTSKAQNCALFPLYVAGAHSLAERHRNCVMETLDIIHTNLRFQSVQSVRLALQQLWRPDHNLGTWIDIFPNNAVCTLVI